MLIQLLKIKVKKTSPIPIILKLILLTLKNKGPLLAKKLDSEKMAVRSRYLLKYIK